MRRDRAEVRAEGAGQVRGRGLAGAPFGVGLPRALVWRATARGVGVPGRRGGTSQGAGRRAA
jgi:hypothetical protein